MPEEENNNDILIHHIVDAMDDIKANDITILDLRQLDNAICQYFVICSANSNTQVNAISESVERKVRKAVKDRPMHVEGKQNGQWVLLDYVNVVVHIFQEEYRTFYNIEGLWADAKRTDVSLKQD